MYQNESFDDYIRSILGYPNPNTMYMQNYPAEFPRMNQPTNQNPELEKCYPEIYKILYPMITKKCSQISEPVTSELVDSMTDEIYSAIEVNNEINVNINLQNSVTNHRTQNQATTREPITKEALRENRGEDRQIRNRDLRDLIKILIIRELLNRPGGGHRPRPPMHGGPGRPPFPGGPRPPFPGGPGPGRPPIMPREYDIYE